MKEATRDTLMSQNETRIVSQWSQTGVSGSTADSECDKAQFMHLWTFSEKNKIELVISLASKTLNVSFKKL